jgi:hypothetical protein
MSGATGLDLRYPIGGLFTVLGLMLTSYGLATNGDQVLYARTGGMNINLWWGLVLLVVGLLFLAAARRRPPAVRPAAETEYGRETERREEVLGLEHD